MVIEHLPSPLPATPIVMPAYVNVLAAVKPDGAVYDGVNRKANSMLYQTVHEKPIGDAYLARKQRRTVETVEAQRAAFEAGDYAELRDRHNFRYMIVDASKNVVDRLPGATRLHRDGAIELIDLGATRSTQKEQKHDS